MALGVMFLSHRVTETGDSLHRSAHHFHVHRLKSNLGRWLNLLNNELERKEIEMSILILNTTRNVSRFENRYVDELSKGLKHDYKVYSLAGEDLLELSVDKKDIKVILVVSHAESTGDDTCLKLGFIVDGKEPVIVNNPEILSQILNYNSSKHIIVYCSCNAATVSTVAASIDNPEVVGVVASTKNINEMWVNAIAELVNKIHDVDLEGENSPHEITKIIVEVERLFPYGMGLVYYYHGK